MTLVQFLCLLLSEESDELGQRASKLSRFGWSEVQSGQELTNFERLRLEKVDLMVVYNLLLQAIGQTDDCVSIKAAEQYEKELKILKYCKYSVECNQLPKSVFEELKQITICSDEIEL
ncbi:hypothetical protein [Vibrio owensii]|uniref:hypothetical protein n=1 Tax=Vibrio harveyi group TaxID=717610 RepID=UPI003CC5456A